MNGDFCAIIKIQTGIFSEVIFVGKVDKSMFKKTEEELQEYLSFRKKGFVIENKKGKGSYNRKEKHKNKKYEEA